MSKQLFVKRYYLIINFIKKKPASFKEIKNYLKNETIEEEEKYEISLRTFQRDLKEIEALFCYKIQNNRSRGVYEIIETDEVSDKYDRLMENFEVINALKISNHFEKQIIVEKRKPLGLANMHGLIHAIKNKREIAFVHEKYCTNEVRKQLKKVQPIALKEARYRWYLIGKDSKDNKIKTFGLDRISDLEITKNTFLNIVDYDATQAFHSSFGIITNESETPQKVVLSFSYKQGKFIKSFPMHHSQNEIIDNNEEYRVELLIHPTYDFVMELMSMGSHVKVLEPKSLQEEIKKKLYETMSLYDTI